MKIVIIGGHFSPALAVIQNLPNDEILYIGRKHGLEGDKAVSLEYQTIIELGINFKFITTGRVQRKFTRHTVPSLLKIPVGLRQSYSVLKAFKPDAVVGFGSYLSIPVVLSASLLKIPIIIHEQTFEAGVANKFLARFAKKICISWPSSLNFFPKSKTILTGNPIRKEIAKEKSLKAQQKKEYPIIYVTGGSLGSHKINLLIEKNLEKILTFAKVIHQTGDAKRFNDFQRLEELKKSLPKNLRERYEIKKFIKSEEVGTILRTADLIIARSGINTVSEVIYLEKPALFIPLPFSQRQEQLKNAQFAKNLGIAEILVNETDQNDFLKILSEMIINLQKYKIKDQKEILNFNAAKEIVNVIKSV